MKKVISTDKAPEAVGAYSQAVSANGFLFLSGQICVNPATGLFERKTVADQTRQIMENIKAVIEEAGGTMESVVKCQIHLSGMDVFDEMDSVYRTYFPGSFPARVTVGGADIYDNLDVEIDVIAVSNN